MPRENQADTGIFRDRYMRGYPLRKVDLQISVKKVREGEMEIIKDKYWCYVPLFVGRLEDKNGGAKRPATRSSSHFWNKETG